MKRFSVRFFCFLVVFALVLKIAVYLSSYVLRQAYGISTGEQIDQQFEDSDQKDYTGLILGNSVFYRGIDPALFDFGDVYNFAHDNDSYNQMYFKLEHVARSRDLDFVILHTDYFSFSRLTSTRNLYYQKYFDSAFAEDYDVNLVSRLDAYRVNNINMAFRRLPNALLSRASGDGPERSRLTGDGYYVVPMQISSEADPRGVRLDYEPLDLQLAYFKKILSLCKEDSIEVLLLSCPVQEYRREYVPEEIRRQLDLVFEEASQDENVYFIDFSEDERFKHEHYYDYAHLNRAGAVLFSKCVSEKMSEVIRAVPRRVPNNAGKPKPKPQN